VIQAFLRQDPDGYQGVVVGVLIDIFNLGNVISWFILSQFKPIQPVKFLLF